MLTTSQVQPFVLCLSLTYAKSKSKFVLLTKISHPVFANSVFFYTQAAAFYCQAVERIFLSRSMHNVHRPSQQVKDLFLTWGQSLNKWHLVPWFEVHILSSRNSWPIPTSVVCVPWSRISTFELSLCLFCESVHVSNARAAPWTSEYTPKLKTSSAANKIWSKTSMAKRLEELA